MVPDPSTSCVRLVHEAPVARIVLDAPAQHNALGASEVDAFRGALDLLDSDRSVRALVVTGSGTRTFCAGASLRQMESGEMSGRLFETLTDRLVDARMPTLCALNGNAFGGGVEIALCCDIRIGVAGSRISVPAARLGVCYPIGGLRRYVQRLGLAAATRLLVANEEWDSTEMLRTGFLSEVTEPDGLEAATERIASRLAAQAPLATQAMKRILNGIAHGTFDEQEAEALIAACTASADLEEGLLAQREGRNPRFAGR